MVSSINSDLKKSSGQKTSVYVFSCAIALAVGALSSIITGENMMLYSEIEMPALAPPPILFPIVWTLLYILMGISAAMIYLRKAEFPSESQDALFTYAGSLVINFAWSIIFFNMRAYLIAFIWLILLLAFIIKTANPFPTNRPS